MAHVLDACCCAGGMTRGYVLAGHEVTGLDLVFHRNYLSAGAAGFVQGDVHGPRIWQQHATQRPDLAQL
jgi:hypothetical protein